MPALKQEGYAKDATTLQRIIRRLSEDAKSDPEFCARNIERLQQSVADFTRHSTKKVKERASSGAKRGSTGARSATEAP